MRMSDYRAIGFNESNRIPNAVAIRKNQSWPTSMNTLSKQD